MVKKSVIILLLVFFILLLLSQIFLYVYRPAYLSLTGNFFFNAATGIISFFVEGGGLTITIHHPVNGTTYNFSVGEALMLELNVSADQTIDSWWYTLYDDRHDEIVAEEIIFTPNTTIDVVRWENILRVYANNTGGQVGNANVSFFVFVPNTAPILSNISSALYVCEGSVLSTPFTVTDADEDALSLSLSPSNPFFVAPLSTSGGSNVTNGELFSGVLNKGHVGTYEEALAVTDNFNATCCSDAQYTNITVIEINNAPSVEDLGVFTVYLLGDNSTFNQTFDVSDVEDGIGTGGNFSFNISFSNDTIGFNISSTGEMNFTPNASQVGVYTVTVCATDLGISSPHANISLCGQDGTNITSCDDFSITVTNENRPPNITSFTPTDLTPSNGGTTTNSFSVTTDDPDGTIPDVYWYLDGSLIEIDSGSSSPDLSYTFGCGVSGLYEFLAVATDGLLNDSVQWNVSITEVSCTTADSGGGGGGGGGGGPSCVQKWGCDEWEQCRSVYLDYQHLGIDDALFEDVTAACDDAGIIDEECGYYTRECIDTNECGSTSAQPDLYEQCIYTTIPSCFDGITNCHDGLCEVLVDCGGPCGACPTCSDEVQNQGEQGVDCGGPCPTTCPAELPVRRSLLLVWGISLFLLLLLIIIILLMRQIYKERKRLHGGEKKRS